MNRDRYNRKLAALSDVLPLLPPDLTKLCAGHLRAQARLGAAEAGLACERFRLTHQRWPQSLEELVKSKMLDAVPTDSFDGQPLRLIRVKDGLIVYSVGQDKKDEGGNLQRDPMTGNTPDIGFRLWDVEQRRQPPRPPVVLEN